MYDINLSSGIVGFRKIFLTYYITITYIPYKNKFSGSWTLCRGLLYLYLKNRWLMPCNYTDSGLE